jgi:hypothetical protein
MYVCMYLYNKDSFVDDALFDDALFDDALLDDALFDERILVVTLVRSPSPSSDRRHRRRIALLDRIHDRPRSLARSTVDLAPWHDPRAGTEGEDREMEKEKRRKRKRKIKLD